MKITLIETFSTKTRSGQQQNQRVKSILLNDDKLSKLKPIYVIYFPTKISTVYERVSDNSTDQLFWLSLGSNSIKPMFQKEPHHVLLVEKSAVDDNEFIFN